MSLRPPRLTGVMWSTVATPPAQELTVGARVAPTLASG